MNSSTVKTQVSQIKIYKDMNGSQLGQHKLPSVRATQNRSVLEISDKPKEKFETLMKVNWENQIMNLNYKVNQMKTGRKEQEILNKSDYDKTKKKIVSFVLPEI